MAEVKVTNGTTFCKECGQDVAVTEKPGAQRSIAQLRRVLVDQKGHVIADRSTDEPWQEAA